MAYQGYKGYGTPENVARKRRIAEALAANVFRGGRSPQTIGDALNQGLGQVGAALASRGISRKADKTEREAREASGSRSREAIVAALTGRAANAPSSADSIDPDGRGTAPQQRSPAMADGATSAPPVDMAALQGVDPRTVDAFGNLQASYGQPLNVTSGLRSPEHNTRVGGANQSRHMAEHGGDAVDIDTSGMSEAEKQQLLQQASAQGFTGIGVYDNSIHLDRGPPRAWGPSYGRESVPQWAQPVVEAHLASGGGQPTTTMTGNRVAQSNQTMTDAGPQIDAEAIQTLQGVLNDPWASPGDKQMAAMILEQELARMQPMDPGDRYKVVGGRLVDLAAEGGPSVAIGAVDKPSALDRKVEALMSTGLDRNTATSIATGRLVVSRHPVRGTAEILDKATGQRVGQAPPQAAEIAESGPQYEHMSDSREDSQGERPDFEGAFGAEGVLKNVANTLSDFVGFGQVFPDAAAAKRKLSNLGVETSTTLAGLANVRGGQYLMNEFKDIQAKSGGLQGPEDAFNVLREMRGLIGRAIDTSKRIAQSNVTPSEKSNANMTVERLEALLPQYDQILGAFGEQMQGGGGEGNIPTVQTPEEARQLPSGTKFRTPDGEIRVVP